MIELIATAESMTQAEKLFDVGIDTLYIGEETFGLRLPTSFSREEQAKLVELAHKKGKKVMMSVTGIMHPKKMKHIPDYLQFLEDIQVDQIAVGDPGVILKLQQMCVSYPFIYNAETMVTSSRQMNFWHKKGAAGAVLAREVPFEEMKQMADNLTIPVEILIYGATCIHQSKRPLINNYYSYTKIYDDAGKDRGLFLSEPKKDETHYSIYEDTHGTHIFADNDLNLMKELKQLYDFGYYTWKLDGLFTKGENFVEIACRFVQAKTLIEDGLWSEEKAQQLYSEVCFYHPKERGLDTGFFHLNPEEIK